MLRKDINHISYPIRINNQEELEKFLKKECDFVMTTLGLDRDSLVKAMLEYKIINDNLRLQLVKQEKTHRDKEDEWVQKDENYKTCLNLQQGKETSIGAYYIGEYDEKLQEILLREEFGDEYIIDGEKKMRQMDIRMIHKITKEIIGVECKDKKNLSKNDLDKFISDKCLNRFRGGILISKKCPIKGYVFSENSFSLKQDVLYIYSKERFYIIQLIKIYITYLDNEVLRNNSNLLAQLDWFHTSYKTWNTTKKNILEMDKVFMNGLQLFNTPIANKHLFLISKSKCKNSVNPY